MFQVFELVAGDFGEIVMRMGFAVENEAHALVKKGHVLTRRGLGNSQSVDLTEDIEVLKILPHVMRQLFAAQVATGDAANEWVGEDGLEYGVRLLTQVGGKTHGVSFFCVCRVCRSRVLNVCVAVDQERCDIAEEFLEHGVDFRRRRGGAYGVVHEQYPPVTGALVNREGGMSHAQTGMAAFGDVALRAAKPVQEKIPQALFGPLEVILGVHGGKYVVGWDLPVKGLDHAGDTVFADRFIDDVERGDLSQRQVERIHRFSLI